MATTWVRLTGRVAASAAAVATLVGSVDNPDRERATLVGTVSRAALDSFEARCIRSGYKVKLGGEWIPAADLVGELEISESRDALVSSCSFGLQGPQWAPLATRQTWTRTAVEVWEINGPPGEEITRLRWSGYVRSSSPATGTAPTVKVDCGDAGMLYDEQQLCFEVEPLAGMTRGAIVAEAAAGVGLTALDVPAGAEYTKPVQAINDAFGSWLRAFIEPELWWSGFTADGTLRCWRPVLRAAPEAADEIWDWSAGDIIELEVAPPSPSASRYVLRGFGAVHVDELGFRTETKVIETYKTYSPRIATHIQDDSGALTPMGSTATSPTYMLYRRIVDTQMTRGALLISQETIEHGWFNPRAANRITDGLSGTIVYRTCYVDEDGEFVRNTREQFVELGRTRVFPSYDVDGTRIAEVTQIWRYQRQPAGVSVTPSTDITVDGVFVFSDGVSDVRWYEDYGLAEEHRLEATFDDAGYESFVTVDSYGYYTPQAALNAAGFSLRSDGVATAEFSPTWRRFSRSEVEQYVSDGVLVGKASTRYGYTIGRMRAGIGPYDYGDFSSVWASERFGAIDGQRETYNTVSSDSWEKVTYSPGTEPKRETFSGRVPSPRWKTSVWTILKQEPFELVVDDPTVEAWWGFRRQVIANDYLQSIDEAARLVEELRARSLATTVRVRRHQALVTLGATIELRAPHHGLCHRALLVELRTRRNLATAAQLGEYVLEVRA